MIAVRSRDMDIIFRKLDVEQVECKHHVRGYFCIDGVRVLPIYYSFGRKDLPSFVIGKIARAMGLSEQELVTMGKCKISKIEYIDLLRERSII